MPKTYHNDKRCSARASLNRQAQICLPSEKLSIQILDISVCGLGAISPATFDIESEFIIKLSLPGYEQSNTLNIFGRIIRCLPVNNQYLIGIEFQDLTPHNTLVIKEFLSFHKRFE